MPHNRVLGPATTSCPTTRPRYHVLSYHKVPLPRPVMQGFITTSCPAIRFCYHVLCCKVPLPRPVLPQGSATTSCPTTRSRYHVLCCSLSTTRSHDLSSKCLITKSSAARSPLPHSVQPQGTAAMSCDTAYKLQIPLLETKGPTTAPYANWFSYSVLCYKVPSPCTVLPSGPANTSCATTRSHHHVLFYHQAPPIRPVLLQGPITMYCSTIRSRQYVLCYYKVPSPCTVLPSGPANTSCATAYKPQITRSHNCVLC